MSTITYTATGRRKEAVAKVKLQPGAGALIVNEKSGELYFQYNSEYLNQLRAPLTTLGLATDYDIHVTASGGGVKGQADAVKLAVARAVCQMASEKRAVLKPEGYLTRDYRSKERKKYGLKKARRAPQFSKR
uniref:Small ribosomal subunit protein uS9c n=2 Tax=Isochrysidaceae TaxID=418951 RepID=A0A3Q8CFY3_9EUKA|nr:ribosomal protein S9 [Tisochrysis lutea]YP_009873648.1 ribosomal protein S9 [Isochrysis galbana]AUM82557.1 ribosomal protein S9 [Tisochrysis lutea]QKW88531.1 ribosomal protein S9 [Isochrysis galbana]|eukprot:scaffold326159_cov542-Tisochrysis_lutea.AAC.3